MGYYGLRHYLFLWVELTRGLGTFNEIIDSLSNNEAWAGSFELAAQYDRSVYGHGTATPIVRDGEPIAYTGFWVDLSDQRRYEYTLRILNRVLRHNLRNDANVILGYIDSVRDEIDDPHLVSHLETASAKMRTVVSQAETARDLESLITEKVKTANEPVQIDTLLDQTVTKFQSQFPESDISFTHSAERDVFALADEAIEKVFAAVVENAVEHNDKETPEVDIWIEAADNHVTIYIGDNGPGVPESRRDQVFGRAEKNQVHHGQGLSLFFIDQMIEKYRGRIWIEDNEPEGAVSIIELLKPETDISATN